MGGRIDLNVVAWAASKWVVDDSLSDYYPPAIEAAVWRPPTAEWAPPNYDSDNPNFCPYHIRPPHRGLLGLQRQGGKI